MPVKIKAYTVKELANIYEISDQTLRTWLAPFKHELGVRVGQFYNVRQIKIIFERLGRPE